MSKDRILQIISSVPALSQRITDLENKNFSLETRCSNLEAQNASIIKKHADLQVKHAALEHSCTTYRGIYEKRFNNGEQYSRRNCFLLNKLFKVPTNIHGWKFSRYVAQELNKLFPSIPVSYSDIDTSHILYKDDENRPVVVVKFLNRDLRNLLWDNRENILSRHVFISEHLTPFNRDLFNKAKEAGHAWTEQCRIFATVDGRKKIIESESDLAGIDRVLIPKHAPSSNTVPLQPSVHNVHHKQKRGSRFKRNNTFRKNTGSYNRYNSRSFTGNNFRHHQTNYNNQGYQSNHPTNIKYQTSSHAANDPTAQMNPSFVNSHINRNTLPDALKLNNAPFLPSDINTNHVNQALNSANFPSNSNNCVGLQSFSTYPTNCNNNGQSRVDAQFNRNSGWN